MLTRDANSADGTLATFFNVKGIPRRLKPEREIALYRIVQEGLNNVAAHAQASRADVTVAFSETEVAVTIADNGAGFVIPDRPGDLAEAGHYGLLGMRERAELADGWLSIESQPGHGTTIEIHLPLTS
jgi:signal transduction histidine kinase